MLDDFHNALDESPEVILERIRGLQKTFEDRCQARNICFSYLTKNSSAYRIRLALARLFYLDGYYDFSRRELVLVKKRFQSPLLDRLLALLGEGVGSGEASMDASGGDQPEGRVVAEIKISE